MTGAGLAARAFFVLLGPFAGDYAATWAASWPRLPRPLVGASRCARCDAPIPPARRIPLLSWLLQRGRRACCGGRIPIVYPLGEAAGLVAGVAAAAASQLSVQAWTFALGLTLAYVALVDLRRFSIPIAGLAALAVEVALALTREPTLEARLARLATGAVLALALELLRRFAARGRRSGLGGGDVLLAALLGALVGWRYAAPMVAAAALAPLGVQALRRRSGPVAFGAWLCAAAATTLLTARLLSLVPA
ncbi:MAG TPA: prepilin peptidase [Caulobacteraceae bacterium]|nr:prepilin peptidase [Caulobacteraceae bacterium]